MSKQEDSRALAREIYSLREAYAIRSGLTNMPYVRCSQETINDRVYLFGSKEDAEAFCEAEKASSGPLTVVPLSVAAVADGGDQPVSVSEVRRFLAILPTLDVDVVFYQAKGQSQGRECYVSDILPAGFASRLLENKMYNPLLQLTGIFFCQQARLPRELQDPEELRQTEEEFSANLVKSTLFLAVYPPESEEGDQPGFTNVKLSQCRFPFVKNKKGEIYMPVFTDIAELQKYARGRRMAAMRVTFTRLHHYFMENAKSYLVNPAGFALPLRREQLGPMAARFGLQQEDKLPNPPAEKA